MIPPVTVYQTLYPRAQQQRLSQTPKPTKAVTFGKGQKPHTATLVVGLLFMLIGLVGSIFGARQASIHYDNVANIVPVNTEERNLMGAGAIPGGILAGLGGYLTSLSTRNNNPKKD